MMLRIMVLDDNRTDLHLIDTEIKMYFDKKNVEYTCTLLDEAKKNIPAYDLYILDIDMPSLNGFELSEVIHAQNKNAVIMFCSSHDELVFDSYRLHTFFFIRKSHLKEDMQDALDKFMPSWKKRDLVYVLHTDGQEIDIPLQRILYFEVVHNDLFVHTEKQEYRERKTMKILLQELPEEMFIQTGKSYIVNLAAIREVNGDALLLSNGQKIIIARSRIKEVKQEYTKKVTGFYDE